MTISGFAPRAGAFLTLLLLSGCGSAKPPSDVLEQGDSSSLTTDPCAVALAPHRGEEDTDEEIIRLQREAVAASDPVAHLERLGWAFVAKARTSFDQGFYTLAEQTAQCIESKRPNSMDAMLLRGHVMHQFHRFEEAEALGRELVKRRGLSFDFGLLGDALLEQGEIGEAVQAYQEMMDQKPSPQAYSRVAHVRWLKGDLDGAMEMMAMTVGAGGARDHEFAAWARVRLANYELQAGRSEEASKLVAAALALRPGFRAATPFITPPSAPQPISESYMNASDGAGVAIGRGSECGRSLDPFS